MRDGGPDATISVLAFGVCMPAMPIYETTVGRSIRACNENHHGYRGCAKVLDLSAGKPLQGCIFLSPDMLAAPPPRLPLESGFVGDTDEEQYLAKPS